VQADTVANERTVMVHFQNTAVAARAMVRSGWLDFIAFEAEFKLVDFVNAFQVASL
jgi:hypothetical protein